MYDSSPFFQELIRDDEGSSAVQRRAHPSHLSLAALIATSRLSLKASHYFQYRRSYQAIMKRAERVGYTFYSCVNGHEIMKGVISRGDMSFREVGQSMDTDSICKRKGMDVMSILRISSKVLGSLTVHTSQAVRSFIGPILWSLTRVIAPG